jgi:serine/threonine protein kinase
MDRQTFLANVRQSGLLQDEQVKPILSRLPETNRGKVVARALVEAGLLTRFQAELLLAGRTSGFILGQYRILDQLGRGGMGRVFKAEHMTMNRVVALKVLSSSLVKTERARQLFQREVRAAAKLVHPNIVTAYDANQIDNRYYLVMEYVNGPNLDELVRQKGPLPVVVACDFIKQAAQGLQYAYEQGMVHRDIKPANLLLQTIETPGKGRQNLVKVLDFGLARLHTRTAAGQVAGNESLLTPENTVMGTPDYLSPEQARNLNSVDIRSDLYSLGCSFYFLLTGKVPFPGGTTVEKLVRHGTEEPVAVEQLRHDVPPPVAATIRRLMAKDPALRFQTPGELVETLAPFSVLAAPPVAAPARAAATAAAMPAFAAQQSFNFYADDEAVEFGNETPVGALPVDLSSTPLSATGMASFSIRRQARKHQNRQLTIALILALGIVAGLVALVGWFMLRP